MALNVALLDRASIGHLADAVQSAIENLPFADGEAFMVNVNGQGATVPAKSEKTNIIISVQRFSTAECC
jgi:hypothetical protein